MCVYAAGDSIADARASWGISKEQKEERGRREEEGRSAAIVGEEKRSSHERIATHCLKTRRDQCRFWSLLLGAFLVPEDK
jgi:hypothetical protein